MESTTLIPYSVHLRRDIHAKIKEAAGNRKAASLVRDAITSYIEGGSMYDSGYRAGLRDAVNAISKDEAANSVALNGKTIAIGLVEKLINMFPTLKVKNGNKKTTSR
jgi:hypothetical protein